MLCGMFFVVFLWLFVFFFSSRRRHTRFKCDWSSDVCSSDLICFASHIQVRHGGEVADARQMASLLQLGLREGDKVTVSAEGPDASAAVQRLCAVAQALVAQERADADAAARKAAESPATGWLPPLARPAFVGLGASPGLAVARIHQWRVEAAEIPDLPQPLSVCGAPLHAALAETQGQLPALADHTPPP